MLPSAGIQVSTHNLQERGEQGRVRAGSPAGLAHTQSQVGSAEPRRRFLSGEATQWDPGPTGEAEADGRPTGHTGELFTNHFVIVLISFSP